MKLNGAAELRFEGCNLFRQRICFSLLSGKPVTVVNIRSMEEVPGVQEHETKLLELLTELSNGTIVTINRTGTQVRFEPGLLNGGKVELDCGNQRCISYFLEALLLIAPFCGSPIHAQLTGITNKQDELSVDAIRTTWLPVFSKFILDDENLSIKINARGFAPDGGGSVTFTAPVVKKLRPVKRLNPGKVKKIRGQAYVCKVNSSLAHRMIDAAKKRLHGYLSDVYVTVDQRKGVQGGASPGFGICLTAETTEGVLYHGELCSRPVGSDEQCAAEDLGEEAADRLLTEIWKGGCLDSSAQSLASTFMALNDRDVQKFLFGPPTTYTVHTLRNLRDFFEHHFKLDDVKQLDEAEIRPAELPRTQEQTGSEDKLVLTCMGVGFLNLNKGIL